MRRNAISRQAVLRRVAAVPSLIVFAALVLLALCTLLALPCVALRSFCLLCVPVGMS